MAKRGAGTYLTDRNWDEDEEKEEVCLSHAPLSHSVSLIFDSLSAE